MEWYHIYLFTRIDAICNLLEVLCAIFGAGAVIWVVMYIIGKTDIGEAEGCIAKQLRVIPIVFLISVLCLVLMPTQKEVAAIYLIPKVVNNEKVIQATTNLGNSALNLSSVLEQKTKQWLDDQIKPEIKKEKK